LPIAEVGVRLSPWNYAPAAVLSLGSLAVAASLSLAPRDPSLVAAVFPPWWGAERSLDAAAHAGAIAGVGALSFIVAVRSAEPGLSARLREVGAFAVIDDTVISFCGGPAKRQ